MAVFHMTAPQRPPEWHEARRSRVTASMSGAILGLSPYMTRDDAMRAMVRSAHGVPAEFTGNAATAWGEANEPNAVLDYEMDTGNRTTEAGFVEFEDWLGASPDRYVGEEGLLEIKCPYGLRNEGPDAAFKCVTEQPHYYAQVQIQLFVTQRERCHFYQWIPAAQKLETVEADKEWLDHALPCLRQFHAEFLHERDHNAAEHLEPRRVTIDTPQAAKMLAEYDDLVEAAQRAEERRKELLAEMVKLVGERDALLGGRKLTLVRKDGAVSYAKALKALCPGADLEPWRGAPSSFWKLT